jgi:hypothetical protein
MLVGRVIGMTTPTNKTTSAYLLQSILSFGIALAVVVIGEVYLPVPSWTRAFLALGTLYLVSSSFTLAKCVRDQQESSSVLSRLDQARLERLLAEFDPYRPPTGPEIPFPTAPEQPLAYPARTAASD